jgi:hypothetical protein
MARSRRRFAHLWRIRERCLVAGGLIAACLVAIDVARGEGPGRGPPADTGPPVRSPAGRPESVSDPPHLKFTAAATPAAVSDAGELDLWHQNLIRDRQLEVRLRTARRDVEAGRLIAGLSALQSIIEREEDIFVRFDSDPIPSGAHTLASRILGTLPAPALVAYESLCGSEARQQLDAMKAPDPELLGRIVRRFYHTAAGFEAGNRLAAYWSDRGHDELAWGWWQRVVRDASQASRLQSVHRLRAAECCRRLGRHEMLHTLLADLPADEAVRIGGAQTTIGSVRNELLRRPVDGAALAAAEMKRGTAGRNVSAIGSPPALRRACWRGSLASTQGRHLETLARAWESHQLQNGLPIGTSQSALFVGERLVYRDFEGIRSVDVRTGKTHWYAPCVSSVGREISSRQTIPTEGNPDPNNVMRHIVGNAGAQALATDGRHVFAIDRIETEDLAPQGGAVGDGTTPARQQCNVLTAFELVDTDSPPGPKWIAGGRTDGAAPALRGHFFLGAPLVVADRLLVVSECRQQLCLSCLAATSGALIWTQPLCSVSQPISSDPQRTGLACAPSYGDGIVVCPTQAGVLVAVDALTGTLLWAASHDECESQHRQQMSAWLYQSRRPCAHAAYVNLPVIHGARVFYLPAHSEFIHCVDRASGRVHWRTRREDLESATATEYVAAAGDTTVMIVGRRRCRGLDARSGAERWGVRLGSSPAGRGVRLGSHYHVPLDNGGIIGLELDSGRASLAPRGETPRTLGNLIAGNNLIVSIGPTEIAIFPQAERELDRLCTGAPDAVHDQAALLEIAELELILGRLESAESRLEAILKQPAGQLAADRASDLLREALCRRFADCERRSDADLVRLAGLSQTPEHFGRYLVARNRAARDTNEFASALAAAREFSCRANDAQYVVGDDPSREVAGHVLAAEQVHLLSAGNHPSLTAVDAETSQAIGRAVANHDSPALRRLTGLLTDRARADEARWRLAQLLLAEKKFQQAETVLLACRASSEEAVAGRATRLLAELWSAQGLAHDVARLFVDLAGRFAGAEVSDNVSGAEWLAARPRDDPSFEAYRRLARPAWSGVGARIVEGRIANEALQTVYNGNGSLLLPTPRESPFELFDRGRGMNGVFAVVNRHTGQEYPETIQAPGRFFYPVSVPLSTQCLQHAYVGNFFPLGGMGALYGVSLLERKLLWTTVPAALEGLREVVRVGPAGPGFCTFQLRQHLFVVDPLDGHLLWHRDDLEGSAGLMNEPFRGIIGDERVLTVFATNGANYTVYDTATGAELRRGKIDVQSRLPWRVLGRCLFHYTAAAENRRVRVWDPLTDRATWDEPADTIAEASVFEGVAPGTKIFAFVRETDEAAYVTNSGTIRVVNLQSGKDVFELAVPSAHLENASALRAFHDRERYFFNVQRSSPPGKSASPASANLAISDTVLPAVHLEGDLLAVDAHSRRLLWRRSLGKRTLLQMPDLSLPVLVSLSRTRREDQSYLAVEILDAQSGQTLAVREDLLTDRLLQAAYDRQGASIELRGAKTVIRLEFPASVAQSDATARK